MRVTTLIENNALEERDDLQPEFGLSLCVELNGTKILFDTGTSGAFAANAEKMGVEISEVDVAVLSHQHFEHGGGLDRFFKVNDRAPVFMREAPLSRRYFKAFAVIKRPIGIDLDLVNRFSDRIEFVDGIRVIAPGVHLLTQIGSVHPKTMGNRHLFEESGGALVLDAFTHELVMVIHEDDGMVVFTGCSHSGILNLIDAARAQFPRMRVKAVFGGFHLIGLPFFNSMAVPASEVRKIGWQVME
ncbi:MAG: MBL fold metallo-hydrolase, partial [Acidobacteriota bacterium]